MRGQRSGRRGHVGEAVGDAGTRFLGVSSFGHTHPTLGNVPECALTFAPARAAGGRSLRIEQLHGGAAYHPEALGELRVLLLAARAVVAPLAR